MTGKLGGAGSKSGIIGINDRIGFSNSSIPVGTTAGNGFYNILTPNGGYRSTYCIQDEQGFYMVIGKFAADACLTVGDASIPTNRDTVKDSSGTVISCNFGDYPCHEIRFIGTNSIEGEWWNNRNIDFIHGIDGKPFKNVWEQSRYLQVHHANNAGTSWKYGYWCTYCKDGRGRWANYNYHSHAMTDGANVSIDKSDFTEPSSFTLNVAGDAKFTVHSHREASGQDGYCSAGFGLDDTTVGFFDYTTGSVGSYTLGEVSNFTSVARSWATAVYVCIR